MLALTNHIKYFLDPIWDYKIRANIGWLFSGRAFRLVIGFFVSIIVARHLGPSRLGILSYAISLKTFFHTFVYLGLSGLIVRELVRSPEEENLLLGTTFFLKLFGAILGFIALLLFAFLARSSGWTESLVILIIGLSLFPEAFGSIDFWFQAQVRSKYVVLAKNIAFTFSAGLKVFLVYLDLGLVSLAIVSSLEFFLAAFFLVVFYKAQGGHIRAWAFRFSKALGLLRQSWIIILSGFFALVYLKVDQLMLRVMIGTEEVGIYSVAARISEVWYFIPTTIAASVFPKLISLKKEDPVLYKKNLQRLFDLFFIFAASVAVACQFFAGFVIPFLYGEAFSATATILQIHIWAGIFMFQRAILSKWFFIEDALEFSLYSHGLGALSNVSLNWLLIPLFQGRGAAIATLVSYAIASYFFLFFWKKTKPLAQMVTRSYLFPLRAFSRIVKKQESGKVEEDGNDHSN